MGILIGEAADWVVFFNSVFKLDISAQFLDCMNVQLSKNFIYDDKGLYKQRLLWPFRWDPELKYGVTSSISVRVFTEREIFDRKIAWRSKSGRIYQIGDEDIDYDDVAFWLMKPEA
ncbi:hypothetical protein ABIE26_003931 [Pedobacter africanus]|uniref:Uncharacterized protein n=1 Tax=Pedobacter africanus TaxID=151894 RepID=A0ACC6L156_9SPHI|nr:hypothetical protein [Pedobacter africanus]MDR6785232.1 hypothetical protein [Pedobacter africanus]